jgi:aminoglycoside phosphotransferase (APT) family kinase protein
MERERFMRRSLASLDFGPMLRKTSLFNQDSQELVAALLRQAGITRTVQSVQAITNKGITNQMSLLTLQDGERFIVRRYQWPWAGRDHHRLHKEQFLHSLLRQVGVPVPAILADAELAGQSAVLMEYVPGEALGDVTTALSEAARAEAWHSCGQMLRRTHSISYPEGTSGVIVGDQVQPFTEFARHIGSWEDGVPTWGHCQIRMIVDHFHQLMSRKPEIARTGDELRAMLTEALPFLNRTPPTLLHNDAHPWNVLVRSDKDHWHCCAWLDWEYAWVGDPNWDLVRMDLFRSKPIGPTPQAFWEGYGRPPSEPERSVYQMHIFLWMANQYLDGDRHLLPTYEAAMSYVNQLDMAVKGLRRLLAESS